MRENINKKIFLSSLLILISIISLFNYSTTIITQNKEKMEDKVDTNGANAGEYMRLDKTVISCKKGQKVMVTATGSSYIKNYSSSNTKVATVIKTPNRQPKCMNCIYLDVLCEANGNAIITVNGNDGASAKLNVSVTENGQPNKYVVFDKNDLHCEKGKSVTVDASLSSTLSSVSTKDKSIATISKDASVALNCPNCYRLVVKCLKTGNTTFTAKGKDGATKTGKITVSPAVANDSIKVDVTNVKCEKGKSKIVRVTGTYAKASSSDKNIAKVSKNPNKDTKCTGNDCTSLQISCLKEGTATITYQSKGGKKATTKVTVERPTPNKVENIKFEKASYNCDMSKSTSFVINITTKNDSITKIESSDTYVATVKLGNKATSPGENRYAATVTCLQDGKVNLTAVDNKNNKATASLTVTNGGIVDLPREVSCKVGEKKMISAKVSSQTSNTGIKSFSMGDKTIATASRNNMLGTYCIGCTVLNINCLKEGKTTLTVKSTTGAVGKSTIMVNSDKMPNKVVFNSSSYKCDISSGNKKFTTYVTAGIDKIKEVKSENSNIASVSFKEIKANDGTTDKVYEVVVTCKSVGSTRITAKSEKNVDGSAKVKVTKETKSTDEKLTFDKTSYSCQKGTILKIEVHSSLSGVKALKSSDEKIAKVLSFTTLPIIEDFIKVNKANSSDTIDGSYEDYLVTSNCARSNDVTTGAASSNCISSLQDTIKYGRIDCLKNGTVTLTATTAKGTKKTAKLTVKTTVSKSKVTFGDKYKCSAGETISGLVKITNTSGEHIDLEDISKVTSSNDKIAKVSLDGDGFFSQSKTTEKYQKIKINCIKEGTVTLKATTNTNVTGSGSVTVSKNGVVTPVITGVRFTKDSYECTVGKSSEIIINTIGTSLQNAYSNNFMIGYLAFQGSVQTGSGSNESTNHTFKVNCLKEGTTTLTAVTKDGKSATATLVSKKQQAVEGSSLKFEINPIKCVVGRLVLSKIKVTGGEKVQSVTSSNSSIATAQIDSRVINSDNSSTILINCLKSGNAVLTATGTSGITDSAKVEVINEVKDVPVTKIDLNKSIISMVEGQSVTIDATVTPNNATNKTITWSSSNNNVATVDSNGLVTGVSVGNVTITATAASGVKALAKITVQGKNNNGRPTIKVEPDSINMAVGNTKRVKVTVGNEDPNAGPATIGNASSANDKIASVEVDHTNQYKCIDCRAYIVKCNAKGTTTITYTSNQGATKPQPVTCTAGSGGGSSAPQIPIKSEIPVKSVDLADLPYHLVLGTRASINVDVQPANASDKTLTWSSSNTNVAIVEHDAVTAVGVGEATITATASNGKKDTLKVYVTAEKAKYMDFDTTSVNCKVGGTATIIAQGTSKISSFKSNDSKIAKIENHPFLKIVGTNQAAAYRVSCLKKGTTTIEVKGSDGATGKATVKVN